MSVGTFCNREVVFASGDESVQAGARLMREHHVGDLVLVEDQGSRRVPVGIVTDRDLVVEVMAAGVAPEDIKLADVVTGSFFMVHEDHSLFDALEMMRARGGRRRWTGGDHHRRRRDRPACRDTGRSGFPGGTRGSKGTNQPPATLNRRRGRSEEGRTTPCQWKNRVRLGNAASS